MGTAINKKIIIIFVSLIIFFLFQNFSSAEWITKKSDISKKLLEVDDMYSKGYLNKSECVKAKAKLLKISISASDLNGKKTKDLYSMMGFTKAYNTAKKSCA